MNDKTSLLARYLQKHELENRELVSASTEQLSFKVVQKGRLGRPLTRRLQMKILSALENLRRNRDEKSSHLQLADLFEDVSTVKVRETESGGTDNIER